MLGYLQKPNALDRLPLRQKNESEKLIQTSRILQKEIYTVNHKTAMDMRKNAFFHTKFFPTLDGLPHSKVE